MLSADPSARESRKPRPDRRVGSLTLAILARVDQRAEIEVLVSHQGRGPGTDAERRAAVHLRDRLEDIGRDARTETALVHPRYALTHLIHATLAVAGGLVATSDNQTARLVGTI